MRTLEIGIRAGSACNDRDSIRERTRDPPRYLSVWNFLRWESLFLVENKKILGIKRAFSFSSSFLLFFSISILFSFVFSFRREKEILSV